MRVWMTKSGLVLTGLACVYTIMAAASGSLPRSPRIHSLPTDRGACVVNLSVKGQSVAKEAVARTMSIYADGAVAFVSPFGPPKQFRTRMGGSDLQDFLNFAIDRNRFFEINGQHLQKTVGIVTDDAPTTSIRIRADGTDHEVDMVALSEAAERRPDVVQLQQLHAIYLHLMRLMNVTVAGGEAELERALQIINAQLAREKPGQPPLSVQELELAHPIADDGVRLRFLRTERTSIVAPSSRLLVEMDRPVNGPPTVRVKSLPN